MRTTFTTKDEVETATATIEPSDLATEYNQFLYLDQARKINARIFDHTYNSGTAPNSTYSVRLSGAPNEKVGLAKSLSVMPGDKISIEVFAKYVSGTGNDPALMDALAAIAATAAGSVTSAVIDGSGYITASGSVYPFSGWLSQGDNESGPKAYLNYLVFDRNYAYKDGGFRQLTSSAKESGDVAGHTATDYEGSAHERLAFDGADEIKIKEAGYVYIWLSNEETSPVEVYFDDFKVTHIKSPVIQTDSYYPFGLRFDSYSRESSLPNKTKLFQGQEHIDDLGLNWDSFKWRNHQPDIGRFFNVDPLSQKYVYNSPYAFSENHVTSHVELEGLEKLNFNIALLRPIKANIHLDHLIKPLHLKMFRIKISLKLIQELDRRNKN
ncbi:MAG: hypothetical protein WDN75_09560 [Bacteroidota bacterium]